MKKTIKKVYKSKKDIIKLPNKLAQAYANRWLQEHKYDYLLGKEYV